MLELLDPRPGETVVDATIGHGGHARLLAERIGAGGRLIGLDVDPLNLERARAKLAGLGERSPSVELVRENFSALAEVLASLGVGQIHVLLSDLGVSTDQLLGSEKGMSFHQDGPLDMRLDERQETTAADLINRLSENELSDLIFHNSQERFSRRIAKRICQVRRDGRIRRTSELVRIVCSATGVPEHGHREKIHPATRTFLALRMAVNHETESLAALLEAAPELLAPGGRIGVISFHSGEDRAVKQNFLERSREGVYDIRTKKPVHASSEEAQRNPRSRSAKLRVAARRTDA